MASTAVITAQCDAVRGALAANACGLCAPLPPGAVPPPCAGGATAAACGVFPAANARALLFQTAHDPWPLAVGGTAGSVRDATISDLEAQIAAADAATAAAFPGFPGYPDGGVTWAAAARCLANDGTPRYLGRPDFAAYDKTAPIIGGDFLSGRIWRPRGGAAPDPPIPVWFDAVVNPDLATVLIGLLLLAIAVGLWLGVRRERARRRAWAAWGGPRAGAAPVSPAVLKSPTGV